MAPLGGRQIPVLCVVPTVLVMSVACLPSLVPAYSVIGHCINTHASKVDYEERCSNRHAGFKATGGWGGLDWAVLAPAQGLLPVSVSKETEPARYRPVIPASLEAEARGSQVTG